MKIVNFGSLNVDHVYSVDHLVQPGETIACSDYRRFSGGKGANQSVALAHAGANVFHAGKVGPDGQWLKQRLVERGVDTSLVEVCDTPTGHASIQVRPDGENAIVLYGGANQTIKAADVQRVLATCQQGDYLLLQNEVSSIKSMMEQATRRGLVIAFNPAPMTKAIHRYPLQAVNTFFLNETEGKQLTAQSDPKKILASMADQFPHAATVLTLGANGAMYRDCDMTLEVPAEKTNVVDTTAGGDTFIGYWLAAQMQGWPISEALKIASQAAAVCVSRKGAADAIPLRNEVFR